MAAITDVQVNQKAQDLIACKSTLDVCKKTMAILEVTQVQGRHAMDMANSLMWLNNVKAGLERQLQELEKTK
jgi:hypothetical protein